MRDEGTLEIVLKYKNLIMTLEGRTLLIKDETALLFLVHCLSAGDTGLSVIDVAVDILDLLASFNATKLLETFGMLKALEVLLKRDDLPVRTKNKVLQLQERLTCTKDAPAYSTRGRKRAQLDSIQNTTKLITLHVHGLNNDNRGKLQTTIMKVKGVVSLVIDVDHQRCALRVLDLLTPQLMAEAIFDGTEMEVKLVSRNRLGQEILKPLLQTSDAECDEDLPPYLPEKESPVRKGAVASLFSVKDKPAHWLNSAVGFLQRSFYW